LIGIDDAAKSNWLGDIFIAGVLIVDESEIPQGTKDCKLLTNKKVQEIYQEVLRKQIPFVIARIPPYLFRENSLNESTKKAIHLILKELPDSKNHKIYIDYMNTPLSRL